MKSFQIIISGRVQGVGYRYYAQRAAERIGINGFVENLLNGKVKLEITCDVFKRDLFLNELKKGPLFARVDEIKCHEVELKKFSGFSIK